MFRSFPTGGLLTVVFCGCGPTLTIPGATDGNAIEGTTGNSFPATSGMSTSAGTNQMPVTTAATTVNDDADADSDSDSDGVDADDSDSEADSGDDIGFIIRADGGSSCGGLLQCDPSQQDCARGEKCAIWSCGGAAWDATRCIPIVEDPVPVGGACTTSAYLSGADDCEIGAQCYYANATSNQGTCVRMCAADDWGPQCEPGFSCDVLGSIYGVCLADCDPLIGDCPQQQTCTATEDGALVCGTLPINAPQPGAPCTPLEECGVGHVCVDSQLAGCGDESCCTPFCSTEDPEPNPACLEGQACLPWFESGGPPPALEELGVCAVPL